MPAYIQTRDEWWRPWVMLLHSTVISYRGHHRCCIYKQNSLATVTKGNENEWWRWTKTGKIKFGHWHHWHIWRGTYILVGHSAVCRPSFSQTLRVDVASWQVMGESRLSRHFSPPQHKISPFFHRSNKNEKVSKQKIERIRLGLYYDDIITQHTRPLSANWFNSASRVSLDSSSPSTSSFDISFLI